MKPQDFTCILRLSKSQLQENGFKDAVVDKVYQQLLEYLASESHTISFPDTVVATVIQVRDRHCYTYLLIFYDLDFVPLVILLLKL